MNTNKSKKAVAKKANKAVVKATPKSNVVKNYMASKKLVVQHVTKLSKDGVASNFASYKHGKAGTSLIHVILLAILGIDFNNTISKDVLATAISGYSNGLKSGIKDSTSGCKNFTTNSVKYLTDKNACGNSVFKAFDTQYSKLKDNPKHIQDYVVYLASALNKTNRVMITDLRKALNKDASKFNNHKKQFSDTIKQALSNVA